MFLSVPPAPVNKTNTAGNVYITTDHNEVVVSTAQVTKTALAEIKSTLHYLNPPPGGVLRIIAYMGRLRPKGVPFSGFKYIKG